MRQQFNRQQTPGYSIKGSTGERSRSEGRAGFAPRIASDLISSKETRELLLRDGIVPIADIIKYLRATNLPPQLVQVGYPGLITAVGVANAVRIVPKNPDRMSLLVCNPSANGNITFSYDAPISLGGVGLGNPVQTQSSYPELNGSVSINAIYAWSDNAGATYPIPLIVYEGSLSIVGNKA